MDPARPLRIGTLGAARITPMALIRPARKLPEAEIVAVAARDEGRARKFASKYGIPRVHASYDELLADPEIDAVYNPLPNGLHCEWTIRALDAGKHVLCEKPIASNEAEARSMAAAAERTGLVLAEAFHWRYHPLADRMRQIVTTGALGRVQHVEASMCLLLPMPNDIRYRFDLGGGGLMDAGCYPVSMVRFLAGAEPEVKSATARVSSPGVDRWLRAELRFADGRTGRVTCALFSRQFFKIQLRVVGDEGEMTVLNPVAPQLYHHLTLRNRDGKRRERVKGPASYVGQLRAFVRWVRGGEPMPTDAAHGIANMHVIDEIYRAAGLPLRGQA